MAEETTTTAAMVEETTTTAAEVTTTTQLTGIELAGGEGSCAPEPEAAPPRGVAPVDGMTIVRAISGDVSTIDPRRNFEARASEMVANMYDQLTTFHLVPNADGVLVADSTRPQGLLAESWDFNEDCTSVIFTLRQGVKFHHTGNEMTAEDVRWSFLRAAYLDGGGWFDHAVIGLYDFGSESDIETAITVIDDYHIRFDFNKPTPFPLHVLSNAGVTVYDSEVLMAHATDDDPWAHEYLKTNDVGTGPFYLEKLEPGVEIVLKRNDDYYLGPAQAEQIILRVIPDAAQQAALLTAGEIDFAEAVPVTAIPDLRDQGVKVTTVGGNNQAVMYMNPTKEPFNDVNFRQAIAYAYPYDDVLEGVYFGAASRGGGPIPSTTPSYNPDAPFYSQDLDKAAELLAASSYDGRTLDLYIDGTLAFAPELAIVVQASLAQIGVDVNIVRLDSGQFRDNVFAQDGDVRINPMEF
ncbi:MAG: ABC transporter substrate-binding protein, partial [Acidimicrobiia bacterium]|nr:ABC transporter substrate-binding protein [Acidimicrobiia bacterium]